MHSFLKDNHEELIRSCNTYAEVINKRSAANPDHVVFKFLPDGVNEDGSLTYQQLICKSKAVAAILQQNGSKGDNVLLLFQPGLDYIVSLFACLLSGFVAVPAYPPRRNRGIERIFKIIDDSEVQICLVSKHIYNDIQRNFSDDENLKGLSWVVYDDISNESSHGFIETELMPDDIALLQYTSGSTGDPKGVIISQKNLLYNSEYIRQSFNHDEHLVGVNWLPVFHDMGLIGTVLQPPYVGGVSYLMPPVTILKNPLIWLKAIEKYRANTVGGPNFIYDYCVQRISNEECKDLDLSSVNVFFCGAEPIREATLTSFAEKFKTAKATHEMLYPCYGMAETTLIVTGGVYNEKPVYLDIDADAFSKNTIEVVEEKGKNTVTLVSSGTTWLETEVLVVDPRTNNKLSEGNIGEVWIGGPTVASGYYGREDESVRLFNAFTSDSNEGPYFKSGDLGFIYNKEVFITGRLRDVIIIRGINFYPSDIEFLIQDNIKELKRNAGAAFSVVEEGQERLVIVQELERTAMRDTDHDYVIRKVRELVSEDYVLEVHDIVLVSTGSIPMTSSGKIQRQKTKSLYKDGKLKVVAQCSLCRESDMESEISVSEDPSEENIKEWLVQWIMIHQKLNREDIDYETFITAYGVDSIAAVTLEVDISNHFGFQWHISSFMLDPTINGLAIEGVKLYEESINN